MQNDANQHILLTSSNTDSGSSCGAFCPLYLSQWCSVCTWGCREVHLGLSHAAYWLCITANLALLPQQSRNFQTKNGASPMVTMGEQLCSSDVPVPVHKPLLAVTPFSPGCSTPHGMDNSLPFLRDTHIPIPSGFYLLGVEDKALPKPGGFSKYATVLKEGVSLWEQ